MCLSVRDAIRRPSLSAHVRRLVCGPADVCAGLFILRRQRPSSGAPSCGGHSAFLVAERTPWTLRLLWPLHQVAHRIVCSQTKPLPLAWCTRSGARDAVRRPTARHLSIAAPQHAHLLRQSAWGGPQREQSKASDSEDIVYLSAGIGRLCPLLFLAMMKTSVYRHPLIVA